jgi:hypothetical protein
MDPPPSYEEAMKIIERLKAHPPSAKALTAAHKHMANKAASPETGSELRAEVDKLAGAANQIDSSFQKVAVALKKVDNNDYLKKDGTPEPKLAPGWRILQTVLFFFGFLIYSLNISFNYPCRIGWISSPRRERPPRMPLPIVKVHCLQLTCETKTDRRSILAFHKFIVPLLSDKDFTYEEKLAELKAFAEVRTFITFRKTMFDVVPCLPIEIRQRSR